MSGADPTGVEAAKVVAEYIRLRTLDEDDAANIIHILHEAGVRFRLPSSLPSSDGASETDALARENQWRKLEGRDPALPKPAPDAMREALIDGAAKAFKCKYCADQKIVGRRYHPEWKLTNEACPKCVASPPPPDDVRSALADKIRYLHGRNLLGPAIGDYRITNDECVQLLVALYSTAPDTSLRSSIKVLRRLFKAISAKGIEVKYFSSLEPDGGDPWKEFIASMDEAAQFIKEQDK